MAELTTKQQFAIGGQAAGGVLSTLSDFQAGRDQLSAAQATAAQLRTAAGQAQAAGSMAAAESVRQSQMLASHALAVAGASGAGVLDPTVVKLVSNISAYGLYNSQMEQYNTNEKAAGLTDEANATVYKGQLEKNAADTKGIGSILSTAASIGSWFI